MKTPEEYAEAAEESFGIANAMLIRGNNSPEEDLAAATFYAQVGQGFAQLAQVAVARQGSPELGRLTSEVRGLREELRALVGHLKVTR